MPKVELVFFAGCPSVPLQRIRIYRAEGRLKVKRPVGVTVEIGGAKFSTVSDPSGGWANVFRHLAINFNVTAWNFEDSSIKIVEVSETLPFH